MLKAVQIADKKPTISKLVQTPTDSCSAPFEIFRGTDMMPINNVGCVNVNVKTKSLCEDDFLELDTRLSIKANISF